MLRVYYFLASEAVDSGDTCAAMYANATVSQPSNNPEWRIWEKHLDLMVRVHRCIRHQIKHCDPSLSHKLYLTLSLSLYNFPALRLLRCCGNKLRGGGDAAHITRVSLSSPEEGEKCEGDRDKWLGLVCVCVCGFQGCWMRKSINANFVFTDKEGKSRVKGKYFDVQEIKLKALWPAVCEHALGRDNALQRHTPPQPTLLKDTSMRGRWTLTLFTEWVWSKMVDFWLLSPPACLESHE